MQPGKTNPPDKPFTESEKQLPDEAQASVAENLSEQTGQEAGWHFDDEGDTQAPAVELNTAPAITWTASEYVAHDKNMGWYMLVVLSSVGLAALIYLISRELISSIVITILGISFAAFGARKPRVLDYAIDSVGVHIGPRSYPFGMFKTFSVIEEDAVRSILLMPMQRFNLPISIYYEPQDEHKIVEALAIHLPHEDRKPGPIDNFMRKIRF